MPIPVVTVSQMREWEQASWRAGRTERDVIDRVGLRISERLERITEPGDSILFVCGRGNNGADAVAASGKVRDRQIKVITIRDPAAQLSELQAALSPGPDVVVDALFGIGLNRPLDPAWGELIDALNQADSFIVSIDVPSGLNADSGEHSGAAVEADLTLTVGAPKTGLLHRQSYRWVGRLEVLDDVGLLPIRHDSSRPHDESFMVDSRALWTRASDFHNFPAARRVDSHKGTLGHAAIIAGSLGYHGAAVLAGQAAIRARPGLVSVYTPDNVYVPTASQLKAAMVHPWYQSKELPTTCTAALIGPGLAAPGTSEVMAQMANAYWQKLPLPVVVDASALDWLRPGPTPLSSRRVITPHPGEAARMLDTKVESIQQNRFVAVKELSSRFGNCWVVLKGHQTLIGRSSGEIYVNSTGNPDMAQGGAGDVLAGLLVGLLAQPRLQSDPLRVIRYAVWKHGEVADMLSTTKPGWVIDDLVDAITVAAR